MRVLCFLLVFSLFGCYETSRDCKAYKTGEFYSEVSIDDVLYKSTFKRSEDLQIETYNKKIDSSKLREALEIIDVFHRKTLYLLS